jgi:hypothetical protein
MGTRSLTYVYDDADDAVVCMYRQFDGYVSGHGRELIDFISQFTIVNGLNINETRKVANGMGCLAAQLIAHFKVGAGGFYLYPPTQNQDCGQEYEYHIFQDKIIVKDPDNVMFEGTWEEFQEYVINVEQTV